MNARARICITAGFAGLLGVSGCPSFLGDRPSRESITLALTDVGTGAPIAGATVEVAASATSDWESYLDELLEFEGWEWSGSSDEQGRVVARLGGTFGFPIRYPLFVRVTHGSTREALAVDPTIGSTATAETVSVAVIDIVSTPR